MEDLNQELEKLSTTVDGLKEAINQSFTLLGIAITNIIKKENEKSGKQKPTVRVIPFDIEKAKQGAKVVTRDGHNVRILCYNSRCCNSRHPIIAEIDIIEDILLTTYAEDGTYLFNKATSNYDLMIAEKCI